jgi:pimeloyl-ACP methyl ester carboxylesterase
VLRRQGLTFTHWEKPTGAVLDAFLADHARPEKIVLVGMSMGGYLAPRAAAFDERFDGVVAYDVFFDMGATARRYAPPAAFWLHEHGFTAIIDAMIRVQIRSSMVRSPNSLARGCLQQLAHTGSSPRQSLHRQIPRPEVTPTPRVAARINSPACTASTFPAPKCRA